MKKIKFFRAYKKPKNIYIITIHKIYKYNIK